jgi:lipopolysaccharide transport system ATP-binding protein
MSGRAVSVVGLKKRFLLGEQERYSMLRERLMRSAAESFDWLKAVGGGRARKQPHWLWALQGVDLDVTDGEVVGIVGRNGAGKSTFLKILSGITEPTAGYADIYGRVGSLLEVGAGFHLELTGRENIYLNGALLGMKRREIAKKFDEIVAFSEVEAFLDTPVKRYSSGMYMRLAFAVAAHLEPDVLIVDEVLAVGDAAFQRKCLGRMSDISRQGRTVLFVSHNMAAIQSLCSRAVLIDQGRVAIDGAPRDVIARYFEMSPTATGVPLDQRTDRTGDGSTRMVSVSVTSADSDEAIRSTSRLRITIGYKGDQPLQHARFVGSIKDHLGTGVYGLDSDATGGIPELLPAQGTVECVTAPINLTAGRCHLSLRLMRGPVDADWLLDPAIEFDVESDDFYGSGRMPTRDWSIALLAHTWSFQRAS